MELSFDYAADRQFFALRFNAGAFESVPLIRELRFWGVDRVPCPCLSTMAALIALKNHSHTAVTLSSVAINASVCTALSRHFGVGVYPAKYEANHRDLVGGEKTVAPVRFSRAHAQRWRVEGAEVLTWISLDDLRGPFGGLVRTNIDAFDLTESEKSLIVALCCAGKDVGHIIVEGAEAELAQVIHQIGLELIDTNDAA